MYIKLDKNKAINYYGIFYYQKLCGHYFVYKVIGEEYEIIDIMNTEQGAKNLINMYKY